MIVETRRGLGKRQFAGLRQDFARDQPPDLKITNTISKGLLRRLSGVAWRVRKIFVWVGLW
ncbi:hypothetical protein BACI71_120230 [Bacillus mycoides]|uniref:Uncharacterized protein n=1 Tax=Bacillus mycoides TaxID=1405 RepID=A0A653SX68_BACMY|nr:hypothetical protein BACI71_120230 [Bacillus mycoides]